MRVAYISGGYQPERCGVAAYTRRLIGALGQAIQPVVLTAAPDREEPGNGVDHGTAVLAPRRDWRLVDLVPALLAVRQAHADLVHVQYAPVSFRWRRAVHLLPPLARAILGAVPIVVTAHEFGGWPLQPLLVPGPLWRAVSEVGARNGWFDREMLTLLARADRAIATSDQHAEAIRSASPAVAGRLEIVPIGPNVEPPGEPTATARLAARQRSGVSDASPLIAFFGFLHPVKGLEYLIAAFREVRACYPRATLVLAGGAESLALPGEKGQSYRLRLERRAADLGLDGSVRFLGYVPDNVVSDLLYAADLVALPFTHGASFKSGTLLAALAHGTPVVTTPPASSESELRDGENAAFAARRDASSLAVVLLELLADPARRARLAEAGYALARRSSWERIAEAHFAIYRQLVHRGVGRA